MGGGSRCWQGYERSRQVVKETERTQRCKKWVKIWKGEEDFGFLWSNTQILDHRAYFFLLSALLIYILLVLVACKTYPDAPWSATAVNSNAVNSNAVNNICVRSQQHPILCKDLLLLCGWCVFSSVCLAQTAPCSSIFSIWEKCLIYVNLFSVNTNWLVSVPSRLWLGFFVFCQVRKIWMWCVTPAFSTWVADNPSDCKKPAWGESDVLKYVNGVVLMSQRQFPQSFVRLL